MTPLGFVLNDALNNFTPHSTATAGAAEGSNLAVPGRRPLSLAVPVVVIKSGAPCGRRFVLGSADASVAAQALSNILATQQDIGQAVEQPRVALHTRNISVEGIRIILILFSRL
jgi:gamma-glutamyltranspeptidase